MPDIIELVGILLILIASFWRIFMFEKVKEIAEAERYYDIQERLHRLFMISIHHFQQSHPKSSDKIGAINFDGIVESWDLPGEEKPVYNQETLFNKIAGLFFVTGSLCVVIAKVLQYLGKAA